MKNRLHCALFGFLAAAAVGMSGCAGKLSADRERSLIEEKLFMYVVGGGESSGGYGYRCELGVSVPPFYGSKKSVTTGLYKYICEDYDISILETNVEPATVNWYDAIEFCNRLSEKMGYVPCYKLNGKTDVSKWGRKGPAWDSASAYDKKGKLNGNGFMLPNVYQLRKLNSSFGEEVILENSLSARTGELIPRGNTCISVYSEYYNQSSLSTRELVVVRNVTPEIVVTKNSSSGDYGSSYYSGIKGGAWMGALTRSISMGTKNILGIENVPGVLLTNVYVGGPAHKAGLKPGDFIVGVNGSSVSDEWKFIDVVGSMVAGSSVKVEYIRNSKRRTVSVKLMEADVPLASNPTKLWPGFSPLTLEAGEVRGLESGVYVYEMLNGSNAKASSLSNGDIIVELNGKKINSLRDFYVQLNKEKTKVVYKRIVDFNYYSGTFRLETVPEIFCPK